MAKKEYMKPDMKVVQMRRRACILLASENYGMNRTLQSEEVENAY